MKYDVIIRNGYVVDPVNKLKGIFTIAVKNGKVAKVTKEIPDSGEQEIDAENMLVTPGLVDTHVHVTNFGEAKPGKKLANLKGFYMLAKAGVTTALDCLGPVEEVIRGVKSFGTGINVASLNGMKPGGNISSEYPDEQEVGRFVQESLSKGAFGIKILGGHYPISPEAIKWGIKKSNSLGGYVAIHAGSTKARSDLLGMKEVVELGKGLMFQLCHINAYCRGYVLSDEIQETQEALNLIVKNPNIVSESHMGLYNGTSGFCSKGFPESHVTRKCLEVGGYDISEEGLGKAVKEGYCVVNIDGDQEVYYCHEPVKGYKYWKENATQVTVSFPVNQRTTAFNCAIAKNNSSFIINALSTDGGQMPRNYLIDKGLALVKFDALSIEDFVQKASLNPAQMLGLCDKGHLSEGADADITIIDKDKQKAYATIVDGKIVMFNGEVIGKGGKIVTTERGVKALKEANVEYIVK